ncbi:nicotinate phosphoribosyltransferase [Fulvivirgaceae bacterium BMA12]|uniref:Nicotinate phosphoribosyltransferase n=1 Tax=Agaribacillus aureus TaxID=3051825 RepID=A0ABT8L491_9BACT|nr:nicotinate phosphoribosyltransferase [Fulvivirgaceae bacterium BMA12]
MKIIERLYDGSMTMLTDLFQLTMAYGYWKSGKANQQAVFNLFFRKNPFNGGFTVACGLEYVVDFLNSFKFSSDDLTYLQAVKDSRGNPIFENEFLDYLGHMDFTCDVDAMPEGTIVFPHEPMIRVKGPVIQGQLIETPLLNMINFQSLIATKAARVNLAAKGDRVIEFGLRRAQGIDGALSASRAAYIGGCSSTSNVLAGKLFGIPVSGTQAHSWVMSFDSEPEAFEAYARAMPDNCIFLVDTYDTLKGVENAVAVGKSLRANGKKLIGVRIDSGDLAYFSVKAREILDMAGFQDTVIVASNDLDEHIINSLKSEQHAAIDVWGVGTKLVTAFDQPALGAVYKMSAIRDGSGKWDYKIKLSEQALKMNNPGIQQVRRYYDQDKALADMIFDSQHQPEGKISIVDPMDATRRKKLAASTLLYKDLLEPVFEQGKLVYKLPNIEEIKASVAKELGSFHGGVKRFVNPHSYPVGLEASLYELKTSLILKLRNMENDQRQ